MLKEFRLEDRENRERRMLLLLRWTSEDQKQLMEKKLLDIGRVLLSVTGQSGHTAVLTRWSSSSEVFKKLLMSRMKERSLQSQEMDGGHVELPSLEH